MASEPQDLDSETFKAFRQGSQEAAGRIVDLYHLRLYYFARHFTRDRELAEDAVQESFIELLRQRSKIGSHTKVGSWLFTLVRRKVARHIERGAGRREMPVGDDMPETPLAPDQQRGMLESGRHRVLDNALQAASDDDREVLVLKFFCGMKVREIADLLSIPQGTAGVRIARSLTRLRSWFETEGMSLEDLLDE